MTDQPTPTKPKRKPRSAPVAPKAAPPAEPKAKEEKIPEGVKIVTFADGASAAIKTF
jgi:hypothetical protein